MAWIPLTLGFGLVAAMAVLMGCRAAEKKEVDMSTSVHDFTLTANDGSEVELSQFKGRPILLVNTASKCGFTGQYAGLQALHQRFADEGLVIIAVPANDFLGQEPGSDAAIREFCTLNYGVQFPLMAKVHVRGPDIHPLYAYLTERSHKPGRITWNFNKFLIGKDGYVAERFGSRTKPADLSGPIMTALAAPSPTTD
jgi:glutathione peroxidase